ncbi:unnamed protein product [Owenia fusiformis]|uniref:Long-chain-fatty-acid--CoA ligase n=1 Tax=Owenia fusiformis TaxID=6347 RepID=A0A8J1UAU4_OWEFU|nr:unnamed protein product [Owenia fusiformis]
MADYLKYLGTTAGVATISAVTIAAGYYMMGTKTTPMDPSIDLNNQSQLAPGDKYARVSMLCKDGVLREYMFEDAQTLLEAMQRGARVSENGPAVGWREAPDKPFTWTHYNDVLTRASNVGAGLIYKGSEPGNKSHIGIYSQNRPEYVYSEFGCYVYSMVIVPLYDTLGPEACTYIINQAKLETVIIDTIRKCETLLNEIENTPVLKRIVLIPTPTPELETRAKTANVEIIKFSDLEKLGEENPATPVKPRPDDLCTICYTSGTTGNPKGAMITHKGLIACISGVQDQLNFVDIGPSDVLVSYLPLAHMYERLCESYCFMNGASVGYFQGDIKTLMDDIKELRPTLFPSVPRLLNRLYDKVMAGVSSSCIKKTLFNMAMNSKMKDVQKGIVRNDTIWDKLVFSKVQQALGGRVKLIVTGSAPLSSRVLNFLRCAAGCVVVEGYGSTETSSVCTTTTRGDPTIDHVGPPLSCSMIKLADVGEMNYFAREDKGEVCVKGPNVFMGYLDLPEKTAEALDSEGWLHTGDIGQWLPNGTLKIIDRKKHIFKLAQGEYIAPEKIENIYVRSQALAQLFVYGESLQSFLVGVCVPDPDTFTAWVKDKCKLEGDIEELCKNETVKKAILADITDIGKKAGLHSFEQVKNIHLHPELFSVENGLLTPTFKTKRNDLKALFAPQIEQMYASTF